MCFLDVWLRLYVFFICYNLEVRKYNLPLMTGRRSYISMCPMLKSLISKYCRNLSSIIMNPFRCLYFDKKDDANRAQKMAEEFAKKDALSAGVLEMANAQSETLVKGILEEVTHNYEMKFLRSEAELANLKELISSTSSTDAATVDSKTDTKP